SSGWHRSITTKFGHDRYKASVPVLGDYAVVRLADKPGEVSDDNRVAAIGVCAVVFALLHVPLYGWWIVPLDLAVGVFLGALRWVSGSVVAPATAHVLANLAGWWLR
ncbi:MAG: CPBP family intramembrane metalloprotease, partial [Actinophytocola sp.]|nr:CPBP family intramembrane metalloprotease [Actinophytocola sp.]